MKRARGYQGSYLIGFIVISVVALRMFIFYQGQSNLVFLIALLASYGLLYSLEPWLTNHFRWITLLYFPLQSLTVIVLTSLRPFTDISSLLYVPLCIQASRGASPNWIIILATLTGLTLMLGLDWADGLAVFLLVLAVGAFLVSYDFLYSRAQADQAESQRLLSELQSAHQRLQEYAAQAEELAAARERNRLARELHDSVSQAIFSITLTSQSARLLLDREPARVPEQINRLQTMTEEALVQLRSLIAQLRPPT